MSTYKIAVGKELFAEAFKLFTSVTASRSSVLLKFQYRFIKFH